jgi:hypothetical protein
MGNMSNDRIRFDEWCILEIMGHQCYAGRVTEQTIGGSSFVRIDVPEVDGIPAFSKLFGAGSVYCITPVSVDVAMLRARSLRRSPMSVWDLPDDIKAKLREPAPALPSPASYDDEEDDDEGDTDLYSDDYDAGL